MNTLFDKTDYLLSTLPVVTIAVDGRCASGKTTLAEKFRKKYDCNVFHMDDFFLRPSQRTAERLAEPGGNVDYERFIDEVIVPLKSGKAFSYMPFCCKTQELSAPVAVVPNKLNIIEGSYSCHPALWEYADLHVFLTIPPKEQAERILKRNGSENAERFKKLWIPLEEKYFSELKIPEKCELIISSPL